MTVAGHASNGQTFTVVAPPAISGLTPDVGVLGQLVTIDGAHFGLSQGTSTVTFNGAAASVPLWTSTSLQAIVPPNATTGPVVVTVDGYASNGVPFTVVDEVISYYHLDEIGSVRMTSDAAGNITARYDYLPFGQPWPADQDPEPRRFGQLERELATGSGNWEALDYAGARNYSSQTGRFTGPDPVVSRAAITRPQAWNRYAYAFNNPLTYVDADGRWPYYVHERIYDAAFGGVLKPWALDYLKQVSFNADFSKGSTDPANAHKHALCAPRTSSVQCSDLISGFIQEHLDEARSSSFGGQVVSRRSLWAFGLAVHALTDIGSPSHRNADGSPRTWHGGIVGLALTPFHLFGERHPGVDWSGAGQSIRLAIAGFAYAFPGIAEQMGGVSAWTERAIMDFVDSYHLYPGGDAVFAGRARACALGNPAAC